MQLARYTTACYLLKLNLHAEGGASPQSRVTGEQRGLMAAPTCPGVFTSCSRNLTNFSIGVIPTYFSIVSCSLSCLGSLLIVVAYITLRDIRTGSQKVITLLAIADFFTAFGYLIAAGNFLAHFNETDEHKCDVFQTVCEVQSFITTWSSLCSFSWTCALAFYFYVIIVHNNVQCANRLIPWENIISWVIPLIIVFPLLVKGKLGYTQYATSNWCYIQDGNSSKDFTSNSQNIFLTFIAGKFWEILSYIVVIILYTITRCNLHRQVIIYPTSGLL